MTAVARDSDRSKVYEAEQHAFYGALSEERLSFNVVLAVAGRVLNTAWWQNHSGTPDVTVRRARADAASSSFRPMDATIRVADGQMTLATIAHELAHAFRPHTGHTAEFRAAYIQLIRLICGDEPAGYLREEFAARNLPVAAGSVPDAPTPAVPLGAEFLPAQPQLPVPPGRRPQRSDPFSGMRDAGGAIAL